MIVDSLLGLLPIVGSGAGLLSGLRFVQESQRGVKLRFGRVMRNADKSPRIIQPGFVWLIPSVHTLRRIHVRTQTLSLAPQRIMLSDHTVFDVGALGIVRVIDRPAEIYQSLFEVDDVVRSTESYLESALRDVMTAATYQDLANTAKLAQHVMEIAAPRLAHWGIQLDEFRLTDCSPTRETADMILLGTQAGFRVAALKDAIGQLDGYPLDRIPPTVAAALIGTPVAVSLSEAGARASLAGEEEETDH